jgi:hypothetical protein
MIIDDKMNFDQWESEDGNDNDIDDKVNNYEDQWDDNAKWRMNDEYDNRWQRWRWMTMTMMINEKEKNSQWQWLCQWQWYPWQSEGWMTMTMAIMNIENDDFDGRW